jgi:hypothetical protein
VRAVLVFVAVLVLGACGNDGLDAAGAREFTAGALRDAGFEEVDVARATEPCEVDGQEGLRTIAATEVGEVSLCVSRRLGRALSVRDPGMSDEQFARLDRYRDGTPADRARPLAAGSAGLLLAGVVIQLALRLRPETPAPAPATPDP